MSIRSGTNASREKLDLLLSMETNYVLKLAGKVNFHTDAFDSYMYSILRNA